MSGISKRMIAQFFTEVEGPERDWFETEYDDFDEDEAMLQKIHNDLVNLLIPRVMSKLPAHIQALFGKTG
jgi:hypothetical protein